MKTNILLSLLTLLLLTLSCQRENFQYPGSHYAEYFQILSQETGTDACLGYTPDSIRLSYVRKDGVIFHDFYNVSPDWYRVTESGVIFGPIYLKADPNGFEDQLSDSATFLITFPDGDIDTIGTRAGFAYPKINYPNKWAAEESLGYVFTYVKYYYNGQLMVHWDFEADPDLLHDLNEIRNRGGSGNLTTSVNTNPVVLQFMK